MQITFLTLLLMISIKKWIISAQELTIFPLCGPMVRIPSKTHALTPQVTLQCALSPGTLNYATQWMGPGDVGIINPGISTDRYTITNDTIESVNGSREFLTILIIHQLSYQSAGVYTCSGRNMIIESDEAPSWVSATIDLQLDLDLSSRFNETLVMATTNEYTVELSCEMRAYIRPDSSLIWEGPSGRRITTETDKYQITFSDGLPDTAVDGSGVLVPSRVSTLTIHDPEKPDQGVYTCSVMGTNKSIELVIMINDANTSPATTVTDSSDDRSKTKPSIFTHTESTFTAKDSMATDGSNTPTRVMDKTINQQPATTEKVRSGGKSGLYMDIVYIAVLLVAMSAGALLHDVNLGF